MPSAEHQAIVDLLRAEIPPPDSPRQPIGQRRADMEATTAFLAIPGQIDIATVEVGGVPGERHLPPGWTDGDATVLYLHGGAYTTGSVATHRSMGARVAEAAGARVFVLDYRLAPEHPHPAAVDDALRAYRWLVAEGADPSTLALVGDSAGGGLCLALLLALRDAGDPLPAGAVLLSPWTDLTMSGGSATANEDLDPMCQSGRLAEDAAGYLAGADPHTPTVSPLFADLTGLPPLLVIVGTYEILLDDAVRLDEHARDAGVKVDLDVHEGLVHVFPLFAGVPESDEAVTRIAAWLIDRVGG